MKKVDKNLDDFFTDHDIRIGKDFIKIPPYYYSSLIEAFYSYYQTFADNRNNYDWILDVDRFKRKDISWSDTIDSSTSMILGFHRFFELLIKDLLRKSDPFLAVKFFEKHEEVVEYLMGETNPEMIRTVEFSEAYKRFTYALKMYDKNSRLSKLEEIHKFRFLVNPGMKTLNEWRNRIMHNGSRHPNIRALDYFITQVIVPLVVKIIKVESNPVVTHLESMFKTRTGIEILKEFEKIKFDFKDFYGTDKKKLINKLWKIAHLKELGRANQYFLRKFAYGHDQLWAFSYYAQPFDQSRRFAEKEKVEKANGCFDVIACPCCGIESLNLYKQIIPYPNGPKFFYWVLCQACTYSMKDTMGDPYLAGYSAHSIFPKR
jgi:hypothetical protein